MRNWPENSKILEKESKTGGGGGGEVDGHKQGVGLVSGILRYATKCVSNKCRTMRQWL